MQKKYKNTRKISKTFKKHKIILIKVKKTQKHILLNINKHIHPKRNTHNYMRKKTNESTYSKEFTFF